MTDTHGNNQMDHKTLEALKASIAKWEANVEAETPEDVKTRPKDCPLCHMFFHDGCVGCPVWNRTGSTGCRSTPYGNAIETRENWDCGYGTREQFQAAAQAEVDFLKSLLPGETP